MSADIKPLTWTAVRQTQEKEQTRRAENVGKGHRCDNCADTGIVPAPEPYGSWGCTWRCSCVLPGRCQ